MSNQYVVIGIMSTNIDGVWLSVMPMVTKAIDKVGSLHTEEDIYQNLIDKHLQLWLIMNNSHEISGCYITEILESRRGRGLDVFLSSGTDVVPSCLDEVMKNIVSFAKHNNCSFVVMDGRKGYKKFLEKYGWRETNIKMRMEIS